MRVSVRLYLLAGLLLAGCGKVGDPLPPFVRIPEAVIDLSATQSGHSIVLAWTNPQRNIDGSAATNLAHVQIRSNDQPLATLNVTAAGKPQSYAMPVGLITGSERRFTVVVDTSQGKVSSVSNGASLLPVDVPGPVTGLGARADQRKIIVQWERPSDHAEFADAYIVIRSDLPGEAETVSQTLYEDIRYERDKTLTYQVTPVRRFAGRTIPGVGPESTSVLVEDKTAPAAPTGLDITLVDNGAFVTWNANMETDFAGYRLFRSADENGPFTLVSDTLITTNLFLDAAYRPNVYYSVSAVDEFENESAKSAAFRGP